MACRGDLDTPPQRKQQVDFATFLRSTHTPTHSRRTASADAAFFLPHLASGMALLECGCGPGTITVGLAQHTAPGEAQAIDANRDLIRGARESAHKAKIANLSVHLADATCLPFPNATFDAVFMHALLQHLQDPRHALGEAARVLKPGGVVGVRDADHDGSLIYPQDWDILRSLEVMTRLRESSGTSPRVGKQLRSLLAGAGFSPVIASVTAACDGTEESVRAVGEANARYWQAEPFIQRLEQSGLATRLEAETFSAAWKKWSREPGAFWARFWCEAVAWLPAPAAG
jgi:ubiquinone/menaquinone biosynthesis C-methylase UbiE